MAEPEVEERAPEFDLEAHAREASERYQPLQGLYGDFAYTLESIVRATLGLENIHFHTLESRGKEILSLQSKAAQASESDPSAPKYADPLLEITDLAGARMITFFLSDIDRIRPLVRQEFDVVEEIDKSRELEEEEKYVGYQSIHYIVRLKPERTRLPEYKRFDDLVGELQIRTIMQHAWAEIEHDIQYKSVAILPTPIRRRFAQLAGLLAVADREFEDIQRDEEQLRLSARKSVEAGRFENVEITADALKAYLDRKLGPDGRMKDYAYQWTARQIGRLGFTNFEQLDRVLEGVNDDSISRKVWGNRQGQLTRFEDMLLAAMGERLVEILPYKRGQADHFVALGIPLGNRSPNGEKDETMHKEGVELNAEAPGISGDSK